MTQKITVPAVLARKNSGPKLSVLTAYDFTFARLIDECGIDIVLVGDSLSSVIQGRINTLPVTVDEMIYHTRCVSRGLTQALCIADMPFMSYQASTEKALENAGRLIKEGFAEGVKLEGGVAVAETIRSMTSYDIPVMGHVGLTPQSYHRMGGHKIQGKKTHEKDSRPGSYERVLEDAVAVSEAGAFSLVIEGVPSELAQEITSKVKIPTIGIGAGPHCDGQVLVMHDMLGLENRQKPRFVKRYAALADEVKKACLEFKAEVQSGNFPDDEHSFKQDKAVQPAPTKLKLV